METMLIASWSPVAASQSRRYEHCSSVLLIITHGAEGWRNRRGIWGALLSPAGPTIALGLLLPFVLQLELLDLLVLPAEVSLLQRASPVGSHSVQATPKEGLPEGGGPNSVEELKSVHEKPPSESESELEESSLHMNLLRDFWPCKEPVASALGRLHPESLQLVPRPLRSSA